MCTILKEVTGRGKYLRGFGLKTFQIPGGARFVAVRRNVFDQLQEKVPRKTYNANCRQQTEKSGGAYLNLFNGESALRLNCAEKNSDAEEHVILRD